MIDLRLKKLFFDRLKVMDRMSKATRGILSRFGAMVRQSAITSMLGHIVKKFGLRSKVTNRDGTSAPGAPPLPHNGLLVKGIFFAYEPATESVVIGPALNSGHGDAVGKTVPQVLEEGGTTVVTIGKRVLGPRPVKPRPYMAPAFAMELPKLAPMWANSVKP